MSGIRRDILVGTQKKTPTPYRANVDLPDPGNPRIKISDNDEDDDAEESGSLVAQSSCCELTRLVSAAEI